MTTRTDIIPKLFISFSDATIVQQLKAVTAKLKHREQQLALLSQECRLLAMSGHTFNMLTFMMF